MFGDFFLIEQEGKPVIRAERLAFGETSGRNEAWLRDTLLDNPELLPIREIDPSFGPLIPLCRELRTEAGPLDVAYINPHGRLTLVECKLWRNPEARRKVVAQVLDYARAISRWSYSDLQRQVAAATGRKGNIPYELAKERNPDLEEHQFVDATSAAMRSGRFLLLIAGDGIREDVGAMAELLNRNAASGFAFGLVEVALYGLEDGGLVIQPRTIAKTKIIERTVVVVRENDKANSISLEDDLSDDIINNTSQSSSVKNELGESPKQAEYREWWTPVMEMTFDDPDQEPPKLFYPNHVRAQLPLPKTWLTAYRFGGEAGRIGVGTAGSGSSYTEMIERLSNQVDEIIDELPEGSEFRKSTTSEDLTFAISRAASDFSDDDEKRQWLSQTLNSYVNVLRPRLKKYM